MFSLSFWPLHYTLCVAHVVGREIMINKSTPTCLALFSFVKSLGKDKPAGSLGAGLERLP